MEIYRARTCRSFNCCNQGAVKSKKVVLTAGTTSMETSRAEELQVSLTNAVRVAAADSMQQGLTVFLSYSGEHRKTLCRALKEVLKDSIADVEIEFNAFIEESPMLGKLREVDKMCRNVSSRGVVAQPLTPPPEALVSWETIATKAREKEHLKSILAEALKENRALSAQLEQKKAEAAELADGIATIGGKYKEVQERDARWQSRKVLTT
ncbi:hypothetical protein KFL_000490160 [Klebsormidium nitens]|uniref:Uncharacterized protein n=1 Tax=Klebsormidium nitens TaxID=105231 RepID=A0A0U9HRL4_KLENI|nr:hypothetical protein KFL_000490160 [Klebsormidium nitens]|eukprot:GAQ80226.1 hypothetical protein KFL_000490160 [Klebsormidium nitens]